MENEKSEQITDFCSEESPKRREAQQTYEIQVEIDDTPDAPHAFIFDGASRSCVACLGEISKWAELRQYGAHFEALGELSNIV
ncbi:hypothetical protein B9Z55_015934 [Caenorhabditis nigoni]|uniref:Uncharacterized protein n=1 Tax=Caenorhabditis nigoni TaxID=1611254 RepID=A0A2G5UCF5_9PELO|nr:hypothetical protein B9Z55_015934 [Caenorhabditis nigoni]